MAWDLDGMDFYGMTKLKFKDFQLRLINTSKIIIFKVPYYEYELDIIPGYAWKYIYWPQCKKHFIGKKQQAKKNKLLHNCNFYYLFKNDLHVYLPIFCYVEFQNLTEHWHLLPISNILGCQGEISQTCFNASNIFSHQFS